MVVCKECDKDIPSLILAAASSTSPPTSTRREWRSKRDEHVDEWQKIVKKKDHRFSRGGRTLAADQLELNILN